MSRTHTFPLYNLISGSMNKALLGVVVMLFLGYSILIVGTIISINQRKDLYSEIRTKQAQVSELEVKYFNLAQQIDLEKVNELGFIDMPNAVFAYTIPGVKDSVAIR